MVKKSAASAKSKTVKKVAKKAPQKALPKAAKRTAKKAPKKAVKLVKVDAGFINELRSAARASAAKRMRK